MFRYLHRFYLILVLFTPVNSFAESEKNWGQGPIELVDQYFFSTLHLSSRPITTEVLQVGESSLRLSGAWTNIAALKEEAYSIDVETHTGTLDWRIGVFENFEFGLRLPLMWRGGGDHDSDINSVHKHLGVTDGTRGRFRSDGFQIQGSNRDDSEFDFDEQGTELGNVVLESKYLITEGDKENPAIVFNTALSLPTAADSYGHESVDLLAGVTISKRWGNIIGYAGSSILFYNHPTVNGVNYKPIHPEAFTELEYEWNEDFSILIGLLGHAGGKAEIENHPDYSIYLDTGIKYRVSDHIGAELLFRENTIPSSGSADVSVLAGIVID